MSSTSQERAGTGRTGPDDGLAVHVVVAHEVAAVLQGLPPGRGAMDRAVARIADGPDPQWRTRAERALLLILESEVTRLWQRGWQPADLARVARRRLSERHAALLLDAVAAELHGYADATVEPRWHDQLVEHGITRWWRPELSHLGAAVQDRGVAWPVVVGLVLDVLGFVVRLPGLGVVGALPGDYRAPARTAQASVDAKILARVRALLAKAESTTFPAEAETFTAGAQALMARHSIDAALLAATAHGPADQPVGRRVPVDAPYEGSKVLLLGAVARANRCRTVWTKEFGFVTVVGFTPDLDGVEVLFTSLLVQATAALAREGTRTDRHGRSTTRSFRQSFLTAYAQRIGERLTGATAEQTGQAAAAASGADLLPVLAARDEQVEAAVTELFPAVSHSTLGRGSNGEGWAAGRSAADRAALTGSGALPR